MDTKRSERTVGRTDCRWLDNADVQRGGMDTVNTPFQAWMNTAVNEMQAALGPVSGHQQRVHLFKCFDALMWAMQGVVKAYKE